MCLDWRVLGVEHCCYHHHPDPPYAEGLVMNHEERMVYPDDVTSSVEVAELCEAWAHAHDAALQAAQDRRDKHTREQLESD